MNKTQYFLKLVSPIIFIILLFNHTYAGKLDKIRTEIEQTKQLLKEEETIHKKEKDQAESTQKSLEDRINTLENKINKIEKDNNKLEGNLKNTRVDINKLTKKNNSIKSFIAGTKGSVAISVSKLHETVQGGFSYDLDNRLRNIGNLRKQLEKENTDVPSLLNELWYCFDREMDLGYSSEIFSDEIEIKNGNIKKATFLRIGKIIFAYNTNDNTESGVLGNDKEEYRWNKDIRGNPRRNIRKAIEIMQGKRIPNLVEFPIDLSGIDFNKR